MANVTIDWDEVLNSDFTPSPGSVAGPNSLFVANADGSLTLYIGNGFTYDGNGRPTAGTIDAVYLYVASTSGLVPMAQITNINVTFDALGTAGDQMAAIRDAASTWFSVLDQTDTVIDLQSPTSIRVVNTDGSFTEFVGTGLAFQGDGNVTGQVTAIRHLDSSLVEIGADTIDTSIAPGGSVSADVATGALFLSHTSNVIWHLINVGDNTVTLINQSVAGLDVNTLPTLTPTTYSASILDGTGNDTLVSVAGFGNVNFVNSSDGVFLAIAAGYATHANGERDVFNVAGVTSFTGSDHNDALLGGNMFRSVEIEGRDGDDVVVGSSFDDTLFGQSGNDSVTGGDGNDFISGGVGDDVLDGGAGRDIVSYDEDERGSGVGIVLNLTTGTATGAGGTDTLSNFEDVFATAFADTVTGSAGNNWINGLEGDDSLNGGGGSDTFIGGAGDDTIGGVINSNIDTLDYGREELDHDGAQGVTVNLSGSAQNLPVSGTIAAASAIDTYGDVDTFIGNDLRVVLGTSRADIIFGENLGSTLSGGGGDDYLVGGASIDQLNGGDGSDTLIGGARAVADIMNGGAGNDFYVIDANGLDVVTEAAAGGIDTIAIVRNSFSLAAIANVENLVFIGAGAFSGVGNALNNVLTGGAVNDVLDGGLGADTLNGGAGSDTLLVDNAGDSVNGGDGFDIVKSSVTFDLSARGTSIEQIELTGVANINATGGAGDESLLGNAGANILTGNGGNDFLFGGAGADTMAGGAGNDIYGVDNALDLITENEGQGVDTVRAQLSWTLTANIENLELQGAATNGTGNALNNTITGNALANGLVGNGGNDVLYGLAGNDTLNGGAGIDHMFGGIGDDTFVVDDWRDNVIELLGGGTDTIQSSATNTTPLSVLAPNVENLILTAGTYAIGNALANTLTGSASANVIDGKLGNDILTGGAGADTFVFTTALNALTNVDRITDFSVGADKISLENTGSGLFTALTGSAGSTLLNTEFVIGTAAATVDQHIIYNSVTGALSYDADGSGGVAAIQFALLNPLLAMSAADFIVT